VQLRLLHFVSTLEVGGEQRYLARVAQRLDPDEFEQHVVYSPPRDMLSEFPAHVRFEELMPVRPRATSLHSWQAAFRQLDVIARTRPHVVTTHGAGVWNILAAATARGFGAPAVHTIQRPFGNRAPTEAYLVRSPLLARIAWSQWASFVALGTYYREDQRERWHVPADKLVLNYIGVDLAALRPSAELRARMRADLSIAPDDPVLGIISRLESVKGVNRGIAAFAEISRILPRARLVIVGQGPMRTRLERLASEHHVADRVHFAGQQTDVPLFMNGFDAYLQTTHNPLNGITSIEAMACGIPVVTVVDFEEEERMAADTCEEGRNGLFYRTTRAAESAARVVDLLQDPAVRAAHGARSREAALDRFDIDRHVRGLTMLYRRLAGRA
jgi:glycosyltransferase involved in cell wall biosynthesis